MGAAKATWVHETTGTIKLPGDERPVTPRAVRNAIRLLLQGPSAYKKLRTMQL